ncbi:hypothetical protein Lepto7375DRAFT_1779 [Leptolyngbya sp. PCC 7375]|nr:hypothetical protein Lepto7375DRAFT_1779 [Leptolyngbya sp. PCC 7375]
MMASPGRPPIHGENMVRKTKTLLLPAEDMEWLESRQNQSLWARMAVQALRKMSTLADLAWLIDKGVWVTPEFDEFGGVLSYGSENPLTYEPCHWLVPDSLEDFDAPEDSVYIKGLVDKFGIDSVMEALKDQPWTEN